MTKLTISAGVLLAATGALARAAAPVALAKAREYPRAGISLAIPKGFEYRPLWAPYDVMSAAVTEDDRAIQGVTLTAFPVAGKGVADEFADAKFAELKRNLAIQNLKPIKKTTMPVAGVTGAARLMSYTFRGEKTVAAQVFFFREIKNSPIRICYLLTVQSSSADTQAQLLPTLGAVIKSVQLAPVRHPSVGGTCELGEPVEDPEGLCSVRRPREWYAIRSAVGAEMGQVDYLMGGRPMPSVRLIVAPVSSSTATSEACSKKYLAMANAVATQRKQTCKLVSEGPVQLGTLPAYQFVMVQSPQKAAGARAGNALGSVVLVQRTACVIGEAGAGPKAYMLVLTVRGEAAKAAAALMNTIAGSFELRAASTPPATAPATQPATAPATRPAATRPAGKAAAKPE